VTETSDAPRLGLVTKVSYGFGSVAQATAGVALAQGTITYFLIRVVGMRPALVGLIILLSLAADAIFDPLLGRLSDTLRTPWGRRHPFMYASALPIAIGIIFLWRPPHGLPPAGIAAYILIVLVLLRLSVSLYQIPSDALTPELAPDYHDRTSLISFRYFFGYFGGTAVSVILGTVFLRRDASHPLGQNDPAAYANASVLVAIITFVAILISAGATHRYIGRLWRAPTRQLTLMQALKEIATIFGNPSLMVVMGAGLLSGIATGVSGFVGSFVSYYFWGLTPQVASLIGLFAAPSFFIGVFLAPMVSRAFDKKRTMIAVFALAIVAGVIPPALRLIGLMPPNGSPWLPVVLVIDSFVSGTLAITGFIIVGSMIADVTEDNAVKTGVRSEGLLFAASNLLPKFAPGIGGMIGAMIIEVVKFPVGAQTSVIDHVDPAIMRNMVMLWLPTTMALNLTAVALLLLYRLDRSSHEANLEALSRAASLMAAPSSLPTGVTPVPDPGAASPLV